MLSSRGLSAEAERGLLQLGEGPLEAMSQHRSKREGDAAAGGGSPGSTSAHIEVRVGLTDFILGNGPEATQYGRVLSQASVRFFAQNAEYKPSMELNNNAQSISRPALSVAQLLRKSIRSCLSRTFFDAMELQDNDLHEALAKHAECWTGDCIYSSIAAAEVCRSVTMGSESTAVDRTDAV